MFRIGRFEITAIEEVSGNVDATFLLGSDADLIEDLASRADGSFYDPVARTFQIGVVSWLVRSPETTIIVDTGYGNGKDRSPESGHMLQTPWLERLQAAGAKPADVDFVLTTHLHTDHVGWNTQLVNGEWVPTFPNALYVMTALERELRDPNSGYGQGKQDSIRPYEDSVRPVLEKAHYRLVRGDEADLIGGIDFFPTPGHSPGQMAVRVRDDGHEAIFVADVIHLPIQVVAPELNSKWCEHLPQAAQTRAKVLAYAAETGCLVLPTHFPGTHGGYVRTAGPRFQFIPAG